MGEHWALWPSALGEVRAADRDRKRLRTLRVVLVSDRAGGLLGARGVRVAWAALWLLAIAVYFVLTPAMSLPRVAQSAEPLSSYTINGHSYKPVALR